VKPLGPKDPGVIVDSVIVDSLFKAIKQGGLLLKVSPDIPRPSLHKQKGHPATLGGLFFQGRIVLTDVSSHQNFLRESYEP
jgi:hypothetical protein